jgi:PAS domain S-box-containing protein
VNPFLILDREILDRLHDAVIATDLSGVITNLNSAAERIYEYPHQEIIGTSVARLYPASELPQMQKLIQEVKTKGRADGEFLNQTKTGREIYIHLSVSLLTDADNQPFGMIGFSIDVTDQKRMDLDRREVEELNRAARAATGVGTWW